MDSSRIALTQIKAWLRGWTALAAELCLRRSASTMR
jgi:hypothetical protein